MSQPALTLAILKPDLVVNPLLTWSVIQRILHEGMSVAFIQRCSMSRTMAARFYADHKDRFFYGRLVDYMTSGPIIVMLLRNATRTKPVIASWRALMGPTKTYRTCFDQPETVRACYALSDTRNSVHGSDHIPMAGLIPTKVSLTSVSVNMSARVNVSNVNILNNPAAFSAPVEFEITFEVFENLPDDLEWKLIYVGCAEDKNKEHDQLLDSILVGPVPEGRHKFTFQADAPDPSKIPVSELVGVTVILLTCGYRGHDFINIGFYVVIEYDDPELNENLPDTPIVEKLRRRIVTSDPRVTRFTIKWDDKEEPTAADAEAGSSAEEQAGGAETSASGSSSTQSAAAPLNDVTNSESAKSDADNSNKAAEQMDVAGAENTGEAA